MLIYNEDFEVRQYNKNDFRFIHKKTEALIYQSNYSQECHFNGKLILKQQGKENTLKAIKKIHQKRIYNKFFNHLKVRTEFFNIFNKHLQCFIDDLILTYGQTYTLDIIAFDRFLKINDDVSMQDFIKNKYGDKALKLVLKLIRF